MNRVDEILAVIDTGLQTAGDTAYGDDWPGTCWRCRDTSESDLCDACRTQLVDEKQPVCGFVNVLIHLDIGPFKAALDALVTAFGRLDDDIIRRIIDEHIRIETVGDQHTPTTESSNTP